MDTHRNKRKRTDTHIQTDTWTHTTGKTMWTHIQTDMNGRTHRVTHTTGKTMWTHIQTDTHGRTHTHIQTQGHTHTYRQTQGHTHTYRQTQGHTHLLLRLEWYNTGHRSKHLFLHQSALIRNIRDHCRTHEVTLDGSITSHQYLKYIANYYFLCYM